MARPPPYRALRILLQLFSLLAGVGGLLLIVADRNLIVRIFLTPREGEVSTLLLSVLKEMGGLVLMVSLLLWLASRDPVRNVAILDAVVRQNQIGHFCRPYVTLLHAHPHEAQFSILEFF